MEWSRLQLTCPRGDILSLLTFPGGDGERKDGVCHATVRPADGGRRRQVLGHRPHGHVTPGLPQPGGEATGPLRQPLAVSGQ